MTVRRRKKFNLALDIDQRTNKLSDEALVCRTWGHKWTRKAFSRAKTIEDLKLGIIDYFRVCDNGCGCTWQQVYSLKERTFIVNRREYPKHEEYRMPNGTGRLKRSAAIEANISREFADLLA